MTQSGFYGPLFAEEHGSPPPVGFALPAERVQQLGACFAPYNTIVAAQMAAALVHHLVGAHQLVDYRNRSLIDWSVGGQTTVLPPMGANDE